MTNSSSRHSPWHRRGGTSAHRTGNGPADDVAPRQATTTSQTTALTAAIPNGAGAPLAVFYRLHTSQRVSTGPRVRPVFVLVHGIGMSHRYFARLQAQLIPYGDTVVFDLPGFGGTPTPSRRLTVTDYANVIAAALVEAQLSGCVVIGHSMGAQFVTELAARHPERVSAVVLIGPVTNAAQPSAARHVLVLAVNTLFERPVTNCLVAAAYLRCGMRWFLTELPVMLTYRLDDTLARLTQPVLILRGSLDPIANRAWCERLARTAPHGRVREIPGQPHAVHRTGASLVVDAILDLVNNIPLAPPRSNETTAGTSAENINPSPQPALQAALPAPSHVSPARADASTTTARESRAVKVQDWRSITMGDRQCRAYLLEQLSPNHERAGTSSAAAGPVFVLIHGMGMSHRYFLRLGHHLSRQGNVLLIDLPGYGWTHRPADEVTKPANAELVAALLDEMGVSSCMVVGHSTGVQTATELAIQRPDLVSYLVLIGAAVDERRRSIAQQALTLSLNSILEKPLLNAAQFLDVLRCGPRWYLAEMGIAMAYRLEERLPRATQPVLILRGSRDLVAGTRWSRSLADSSTDGTMTVVAGAPHAVHHSSPGAVAHHIIAFITPSNDRLLQHGAQSPRFTESSPDAGQRDTAVARRAGQPLRKVSPMELPHRFATVTIIFNPNSTGDAPKLAQELRDDVLSARPGQHVRLQPTDHAGHAVELAREAASASNALVVSVSGDGGYNEVVNGVMASGSSDTVCAVLPAGNANDHSRATSQKPLAEAITEGRVRRIDLLRLSLDEAGTEPVYAHSYIGFGLTPVVAIDLEKGSKGAAKEMFSVVRTFSKYKPFEIRQSDGEQRSFDSLVFANISQMAKYATLSEAGDQPVDGKFEVITFPHMAKWRVLLTALRATTQGLGDQPSFTQYRFSTVTPLPYQIDGEVKSVNPDTHITIDSAPQALSTLG